jgi:hypothetical protein
MTEAQPQAKAEAQPEPAAPDLKIRLYPKRITAVVGARKVITAWTCPADDRSPFGPDRKPGTRDDDCDAIVAHWSLWHPAGARLSKDVGHKVLVQLTAEADNRVTATKGELSRDAKLTAKPRPPDKVAPSTLTEPALATQAPAAPVDDVPEASPSAVPS